MVRRICGMLSMVLFVSLTCAAQNRPPSAPPPSQAAPATGLDLPRLESEAILWLQALIRSNTTNPPGNEIAAAKDRADILQREGITSEIFESSPGRGFLVARLSAT